MKRKENENRRRAIGEENGKYGEPRDRTGTNDFDLFLFFSFLRNKYKLPVTSGGKHLFVKRMPKKYLRHTHTNCMSLLRLDPAPAITFDNR